MGHTLPTPAFDLQRSNAHPIEINWLNSFNDYFIQRQRTVSMMQGTTVIKAFKSSFVSRLF